MFTLNTFPNQKVSDFIKTLIGDYNNGEISSVQFVEFLHPKLMMFMPYIQVNENDGAVYFSATYKAWTVQGFEAGKLTWDDFNRVLAGCYMTPEQIAAQVGVLDQEIAQIQNEILRLASQLTPDYVMDKLHYVRLLTEYKVSALLTVGSGIYKSCMPELHK